MKALYFTYMNQIVIVAVLLQTGAAIIVVLLFVQYLRKHNLNRKRKRREYFRNFEEKTVLEQGKEQFQHMISLHLSPPVVSYR